MADPNANAQTDGLSFLKPIIAGLVDANVAIPLIFSTATSIAQLIQAAKGEPALTPDQLRGIADEIEAQVAKNDAYGKAEIARLTLLIEMRNAARAAGEPLPTSRDVPTGAVNTGADLGIAQPPGGPHPAPVVP